MRTPQWPEVNLGLQFVGIMTVFFFWTNIPCLGTRAPTPTKFNVALPKIKISQNVTICNIERGHLHSHLLVPISMHSGYTWAEVYGIYHISCKPTISCSLPQIEVLDEMNIKPLNPIRLLILLSLFHSFSIGVSLSGGCWVLSVKTIWNIKIVFDGRRAGCWGGTIRKSNV